jgi:AhpD family alkylhydroperoxidase
MQSFSRRIYRGPGALITDVRHVLARRKHAGPLMRGETLSSAFRERLMLVVTEVNACRYCAYFHARQALVAGLSAEEIEALTTGDFDTSPTEERPAMLYAQHWAEAEGRPDPDATAHITALYGEAQAAAIELALRMIRIGNLIGNTFDYLLFHLSLGRRGNRHRHPG